MNYKELLYSSYRSSFKGAADINSLRLGARKISPLLEPWIRGVNRSLPAVDLGCGAGELLLALRDLGFSNLGGCDLSAEQVAVAQQHFPQVKCDDLFSFLGSTDDNSLGIITIFDVIEHLGRQQTFDFMTLAHQKMRPGGILIAHIPNGLSPFVGHVFWGDMTHEWCLTPQSARTLCSLHGFVGFEAAEHLGTSDSLAGKARKLAWSFVRSGFRLLNAIETGTTGGAVWTRNFAFSSRKESGS